MRQGNHESLEIISQKARILENENRRLSKKVTELLRENLRLKGMGAAQIELNLPELCKQISGTQTPLCKLGNERQNRSKETETKQPQKGHGPTLQPNLSVVCVEYDLDEADKICPECGGTFHEWEGHEDESEIIDIVERVWVVKKCKQKKYRCTCGCIETALGPEKIIKGGRYSSDVAQSVAVDKYVDHLPLQRQVSRAKRQGINLTNQTLWDQIAALARLLTPVYDQLRHYILEQLVIGCDESPFKLMGKGKSAKWQAWELSCPNAICFAIMAGKSAKMGKELLAGFSGTLMTDGAPVYQRLSEEYKFELANCWSHARRKMIEAEGEAPAQVRQFLEMVGKLYDIERKASRSPPNSSGYRQSIDIDTLKKARDTQSREVIREIHDWILAQKCIPGGKLKQGLEYVAKRWTALTRFLDNPLIPLDNNRTEHGYLGMALGRRNYIGARSVRGTVVAAIFYSIFESAKLCGAEPRAYLKYATQASLNGDKPLLPHQWVNTSD